MSIIKTKLLEEYDLYLEATEQEYWERTQSLQVAEMDADEAWLKEQEYLTRRNG